MCVCASAALTSDGTVTVPAVDSQLVDHVAHIITNCNNNQNNNTGNNDNKHKTKTSNINCNNNCNDPAIRELITGVRAASTISRSNSSDDDAAAGVGSHGVLQGSNSGTATLLGLHSNSSLVRAERDTKEVS